MGIAKPLAGTTATHAACLFAAWGDEKARRFFRDLKANGVQVLSGNKQVATAVGSGQAAIGLTADGEGVILRDKRAKPKKVFSMLKASAAKAKVNLANASLRFGRAERPREGSAIRLLLRRRAEQGGKGQRHLQLGTAGRR